MRFSFLLFALCCFSPLLTAQVKINEAVASNSVLEDEDGDTPDWLELRNTGGQPVDLAGYQLSDKPDNPGKWVLPRVVLAPDEYLLIWASGKDRASVGGYRTLVDRGREFSYLVPTGPVANWPAPAFDDSAWQRGPSGIGYGDGDDATLVPTDTRTVFARTRFSVADVAAIEQLILDVDYDDGFVAYLNGTEIARENMVAGQTDWDDFAAGFLEPRLIFEAPPLRFALPPEALALLVEGENVLAFQLHNANPGSSDLTLIPFLSARYAGPTEEGDVPPELLGLPQTTLHANFKLAAAGETLVLHDPAGAFVDSLRVYDVPADVSIGLTADGQQVRLFDQLTPGSRNPDEGFFGALTGPVVFSEPGGPTGPVQVTLSGADAGAEIRFTRDGTPPTVNSPRYSLGLAINNSEVIRAAKFRPGYLPSPVTTEAYLVGAEHELPVVSLVTDPDNFFHPVTGMYVLGEGYQGDFPYFGSNIWEDTEVPLNFALYEAAGSDRLVIDGGVKIFGGWSRALPQRSLSFFARGRYGAREIEYPLFPQRSYSEFQAFVLRNSGNDSQQLMLRDLTLTSMMEGSEVDIQAYRTVVSYLNGEYWGIYNLREKINEHYLASLHDLDPDELNIVEINGSLIHGSNEAYRDMIRFVEANDLTSDANYRVVAEQIDLANYTQYFASQIYFDNTDWPGNNIKYWQPEGGKWRWILFDTDFGAAIWEEEAYWNNTLAFALNPSGPNWPNPPWSTLLFRKLCDNRAFRHRFINQLADEMNSRFRPAVAIRHINERAAAIRSEIPAHQGRWGYNFDWEAGVERMRNFFRQRQGPMKDFVRQQWGLPAVRRLTLRISDTDEGYVEVNSLTIEDANWTGDYFETVPIRVKAVARPGYAFVRWELDNTSTQEELRLDLTRAVSLRPVFRSDATSVGEPAATLSGVHSLRLSPSPSAGRLHLAFTSTRSQRLTATLLDASGRRVRRLFSENLPAGDQRHDYDLTQLPAGSYLLRLTDANGGVAALRWVKR